MIIPKKITDQRTALNTDGIVWGFMLEESESFLVLKSSERSHGAASGRQIKGT